MFGLFISGFVMAARMLQVLVLCVNKPHVLASPQKTRLSNEDVMQFSKSVERLFIFEFNSQVNTHIPSVLH